MRCGEAALDNNSTIKRSPGGAGASYFFTRRAMQGGAWGRVLASITLCLRKSSRKRKREGARCLAHPLSEDAAKAPSARPTAAFEVGFLIRGGTFTSNRGKIS